MSNSTNRQLLLLSIPGLRDQDLASMPSLMSLFDQGTKSRIKHSFPAVTWPSQANLLTGKTPDQHGVVANGFYWRESNKVEMWTAWNKVIEQPQIWDVLKQQSPEIKTAAWFPMLSKGCGADYVCMPAPIHQPDGSEDLWCYTKPQEFYGQLLEELEHFPLQHFWGPLANIKSTKWICDSAVRCAAEFQPDFFYIYLPHLDYAAQKFGPDSDEALQAVSDLDQLIGEFSKAMSGVYNSGLSWMVASEYTITAVDHVSYPNRVLREAGLLSVKLEDGREHIDFENSPAWALVDHQFSHIFVRDQSQEVIESVCKVFSRAEGIAEVLSGSQRDKYSMGHERSGEVILVSTSNSWQAYYWWQDDTLAPAFASTVDIHRKPGYDPIELHFDFATKSVPLDATLAKGSHGAPAESDAQRGVLLSSDKLEVESEILDTDIFAHVIGHFQGIR